MHIIYILHLGFIDGVACFLQSPGPIFGGDRGSLTGEELSFLGYPGTVAQGLLTEVLDVSKVHPLQT